MTQALMNFASIVESALKTEESTELVHDLEDHAFKFENSSSSTETDESILPAVYYFIGRSLRATLPQLGVLTLCRAVVQVGRLSMRRLTGPMIAISGYCQ